MLVTAVDVVDAANDNALLVPMMEQAEETTGTRRRILRRQSPSGVRLREKSDSEVELAKLYTDWSLNAHRNGDGGRAAELGQQAVELAETTGDVRATA